MGYGSGFLRGVYSKVSTGCYVVLCNKWAFKYLHLVVISVADPDPHQFGKLDPDPHQSGKLDTDPHQSEKVEAFDSHFEALEDTNLEKSEW